MIRRSVLCVARKPLWIARNAAAARAAVNVRCVQSTRSNCGPPPGLDRGVERVVGRVARRHFRWTQLVTAIQSLDYRTDGVRVGSSVRASAAKGALYPAGRCALLGRD